MRHEEHLKAIAGGQPLPPYDVRSRAAGRTAALVPMVSVICAATVTSFLVAYRSEALFSVTVAVWSVAGLVSLAAVTGGVALIAIRHIGERFFAAGHAEPKRNDARNYK